LRILPGGGAGGSEKQEGERELGLQAAILDWCFATL
jgi:hypothetical protein